MSSDISAVSSSDNINGNSELVDTVIKTHRRCASDGNWFDIDRVLNTLNEHADVNEKNTASATQKQPNNSSCQKGPNRGPNCSIFECSKVDMECEVENAQVLLKNITNLKSCGEEKLREMLLTTQEQLNSRNGEMQKMSELRDTISAELAELTSCLFEEANRMVSEANKERFMAEKRAKESQLAVSLLQEEIKVLKSFSTRFKLSQRLSRNQSLDSIKTNRNQAPKKSFEETKLLSLGVSNSQNSLEIVDKYAEFEKLDTKMFHDFLVWREDPQFLRKANFYCQILDNDLKPCLSFCQSDIRDQILSSCEANRLVIESIAQPSSSSDDASPKSLHCQLSGTARICNFKVIVLDVECSPQSSYVVCKMVRNRIAAVCELLTFLRYVSQNLYASHQSIDLFLKLTDLQKLCAMARLGFV